MTTKQSQQNAGVARTSTLGPHESGTLYVVAVPIGHIDDLTVRAIRVLDRVGVIASEDPRETQRLLRHHGIRTTVTSYGPGNLKEKVAVLLHRLHQGTDIALVSDCGSPVIADPGHLLVAAAHRHGIPVVPVPGPSSLTATLTITGLPCDSFYFLGSLPNSAPHIDRRILDALKRTVPTVAFGAIASVTRALHTLERLAPRHVVVVACDLTRPNARILRGTATQVRRKFLTGRSHEVTLVLTGNVRSRRVGTTSIRVQSLSSRRIKTRKD